MLKPTGLIRGHYECRSSDQTLPILNDILALEVVAEKNGEVLGWVHASSYRSRDCYSGVAEFSIYVSEKARGQGVASLMCEHSQQEAKKMDFRAMQYNLVVSTNQGAIRLWQKHGFRIVGCLSGAFKHQQLGFVDAFVMYKELI